MENIKNNVKGITLVALVVTIIILLILAGVAISSVMGDNGLFRKAREAINAYKEAEKNESDILGEIEKELNVLRIGNVYTDDMIGQKITYSANGQSDWIIFGRDKNGNILITTY